MSKTPGTLAPDEVVACYLLDRADQYETDSPCWHALADAAVNVVAGEHRRGCNENEYDPDLVARVRRLRGEAPRALDPKQGVEDL